MGTTQDTDTTKMLPYSVVLTVLAASVANCHPGGYTGLGGLYKNMYQNADYMHSAKQAAKMAVNLFEDESLVNIQEKRGTRQVYVPTFFTSQPQPVAQQAEHTRINRDLQTYELPLYYNEYTPSNAQV